MLWSDSLHVPPKHAGIAGPQLVQTGKLAYNARAGSE